VKLPPKRIYATFAWRPSHGSMASPQRWLPLPVIHGAAISSISFQILVVQTASSAGKENLQ